MPLRCPKCFSGDFSLTGREGDCYHCRECGYTGEFFLDFEDDTAITDLRNHNRVAPVVYDTTDFGRQGVLWLLLLVVLILVLAVLVLGPHR